MTTVISVRFRNGSKTYYFDPCGLTIEPEQDVIVETAQGAEFAQCVEGNHEVPDESVVAPLRPVLRIATDNDRHTAAYNRSREAEAFAICQKKIAAHGLEMKLVRVECSFDGSKILFFFTADGRVDFRELVKDLAGVFRSRIELRQIGVRDEAKMLGGLGICGRPFCCSAYMDEFVPVSIKMAKTQNLSLNPTKISGTCGRLMCCLKYEQDAYEDAAKRLPKAESFVLTPDGPGNVSEVNLLQETVNVRLDDHPETPHCYRNCEVCVLRSGKGSRDGIQVPDTLPERYTEPAEDLPAITPVLPEPEEAAPENNAGQKEHSRSRRRSGRGRSKPGPDNTAVKVPVEKIAKEKSPAEKASAGSADKADIKKRPRRSGNRAHGKKPAATSTPKAAAPESAAAPGKEKTDGAKRYYHRGGKRRTGRGNGGQHSAAKES